MHPNIEISRAENAYELCEDVIRLMRREPGRVNMKYFLLTPEVCEPEFVNLLTVHNKPMCSTVGCFAGWVVTAVGVEPTTMRFPYPMNDSTNRNHLGVLVHFGKSNLHQYRTHDYGNVGRWILGNDCIWNWSRPSINPENGSATINAFDDGLFDCGRDQGTAEYADRVIERIREFMSMNEAKLKARSLREVYQAADEANQHAKEVYRKVKAGEELGW